MELSPRYLYRTPDLGTRCKPPRQAMWEFIARRLAQALRGPILAPQRYGATLGPQRGLVSRRYSVQRTITSRGTLSTTPEMFPRLLRRTIRGTACRSSFRPSLTSANALLMS